MFYSYNYLASNTETWESRLHCFWFGPYLAMLRAYSYLCAHGSFLVGLRAGNMDAMNETQVDLCKASTLPVGLSLLLLKSNLQKSNRELER